MFISASEMSFTYLLTDLLTYDLSPKSLSDHLVPPIVAYFAFLYCDIYSMSADLLPFPMQIILLFC